jgi:hypothetical protein
MKVNNYFNLHCADSRGSEIEISYVPFGENQYNKINDHLLYEILVS